MPGDMAEEEMMDLDFDRAGRFYKRYWVGGSQIILYLCIYMYMGVITVCLNHHSSISFVVSVYVLLSILRINHHLS